MPLPAYRDFQYPLNALMHILMQEEGDVRYLHYGLFDTDGESIAAAQERSTGLLISRLPPPPARLLDVGSGLGTTMTKLSSLGYRVVGITPDSSQIARIRERHGDSPDLRNCRLEDFADTERFDAVLFQESSQYIDSEAIFSTCESLTDRILVLDEFAIEPLSVPGALHDLPTFRAAAARHAFAIAEESDLSVRAASTVNYFLERLPQYRDALQRDIGITATQVDELIESGGRYRDLYADGVYVYRLIDLRRTN